MRVRIGKGLVLVAFLAACGSTDKATGLPPGDSGTAGAGEAGAETGAACRGPALALSVQGTVGGQPFQAVSARASGDASFLSIWFVDYADVCAGVGRGVHKASSRLVEVGIEIPETGPCSQFQTLATDVVFDGSCGVAERQAASGTVQFVIFSSKSVAGTVDLAFNGGDHVSGDFTAPVCPLGASTLGCEP
jgi:hypothetical protein